MPGQLAGIDIRERKIEEARVAAAAAGVAIEFHNASAEAMPFADSSFDVVMFSNSLHHMADIDLALHEAVRVLVPGGRLYIMEPVPAGNYFQASKLVNDETAVRTEAYHAIGPAIAGGLLPLRELCYRSRRRISSFDEWRDDQIDRTRSAAPHSSRSHRCCEPSSRNMRSGRTDFSCSTNCAGSTFCGNSEQPG